MKKDVSSLRSTLEYLDAIGELVTTDVEVDPHLEVAAIQKHFECTDSHVIEDFMIALGGDPAARGPPIRQSG